MKLLFGYEKNRSFSHDDSFTIYLCTAAKVICHPTSGKSKGFGFVKFSSQNQADAALQKMNGQARLSSFIYIII
jgi:RNA recognition motif-containing protein